MAKRKLAPLLATEAELGTRFRRLAQKLNEELSLRDQRLFFTKTDFRSGAVHWQLVNRTRNPVEERALPNMAAKLAISADEAAFFEFGFSEQWIRSSGGHEFKACNLRFAIMNTDPGGTPILFRLEWVGREASAEGERLFPGKGAAHPHWQFDGDMRAVMSMGYVPAGPPTEPVLAVPIGEVVEDLTGALSDGESLLTTSGHIYPWFHKMHIPARALWSEKVCVMPDQAEAQQHEPKEIVQLDNWVISALRYLRHEFETYAD